MPLEKSIIQNILKTLFESFDTNVFAVIDGATVPELALPQLLHDIVFMLLE